MTTTRSIDVQTFLDEHPFSGFQWLIFVLCFGVVLLDGFDTASIGYVAPSLLTEWNLARSALAPVLSAALFGLAAGALAAGPVADWLGRKIVLTGSVLIIAVACIGSACAGSLQQLVGWRFVTGLGLGAAMPNAVTLMVEYCPIARRSMLTNAMFCGFPAGRSVRRIPRRLDDPALGLAQHFCLRRDHAARADCSAVCAYAGIGTPYGR